MVLQSTSMSSYRMTVSYDGQAYLGWQRHGSKPTVQYELEQAIERVFDVRVAVRGSGRTDRGAHANGQVASVELPVGFRPDEIRDNLNGALPADIRLVDVSSAAPGFHACDSAIAKRYRYVIWNKKNLPADREGRVWHVKSPLDVEAMVDACSVFVGQLDFASFATRSNFKQKSTTRNVTSALVSQQMPVITIDICADGFLYKMVRNIVRALVKVGEGRYSRDDLYRILDARDRQAAPGTAPASGLYLEQVYYSQSEINDDHWQGSAR
jgi:tRNA pseudouridine38-40 synthase